MLGRQRGEGGGRRSGGGNVEGWEEGRGDIVRLTWRMRMFLKLLDSDERGVGGGERGRRGEGRLSVRWEGLKY